jgi:hypothetical protein
MLFSIALPIVKELIIGQKLTTETYLKKLPSKITDGTFNLAKDAFTDLVKILKKNLKVIVRVIILVYLK